MWPMESPVEVKKRKLVLPEQCEICVLTSELSLTI